MWETRFPSAAFSLYLKAPVVQDNGIRKKRGRPQGRKYDLIIPGRFSVKTIEKLDEWAERQGVSRSEAIRTLVERGLGKGRGK